MGGAQKNNQKSKLDNNIAKENEENNKKKEEIEKDSLIEEIKILKKILDQNHFGQNELTKMENKRYGEVLKLRSNNNNLNLEGLEFEIKKYEKKEKKFKKYKRTIGVIGRSKVGKTFLLKQLINDDKIKVNHLNELYSINVKYIGDIVYFEASSYDGINSVYSNSELIKLIQEFVITISDILIIVVDNYTLEDLLILNIIKKICYFQKIIIIHNLYYLKEEKDIEYYKKDVLKHEGTNLKEETYFNFGKDKNEVENNNYFLEYFHRKQDNEEINIIHLLYANNSIDELKRKYNNSSLKFIKTQIESSVIPMKKLHVYDDFKIFVLKYLQNPHEKQICQEEKGENILKASIRFDENEKNDDKLKVNKDNKNIVAPKYCIFKYENKIFVYIEFYKNPKELKFKFVITDKNTIIYLKGNKESPNKNQDEDEEEIFNNFQTEDQSFELGIKIPLDHAIIDTDKTKRKIKYCEKEKILKLVFPIYEYEPNGEINLKKD